VRQKLAHWKLDSDLAGVRDQPALARLAEDEQKVWRAFWSEVEAVVARANRNASP
jgi:hypothetical protein